jgi:LPS-assembly lipoprotein
MWSSERRAGLRLLAGAGLGGVLAGAGLGGCGFQRRQTPPLPFQRIALLGFAPRSPMREALARELAQQVQVLDTPAGAQLLLQVLEDGVDRSVVAITAAAQVRELQLRVRFDFSVSQANGRVLIPSAPLLLARDLSYSETTALAKELEEAELLRALRSDIVGQVLRRLAALQL